MDAWHCVMLYDKIVFMAFSAFIRKASVYLDCRRLLQNELFHEYSEKSMDVAPNRIGHAQCKKASSKNRFWRLTHVYVACLSVVTHTFIGSHSVLLLFFVVTLHLMIDASCFFPTKFHPFNSFLSVFSFTLGFFQILISRFPNFRHQ